MPVAVTVPSRPGEPDGQRRLVEIRPHPAHSGEVPVATEQAGAAVRRQRDSETQLGAELGVVAGQLRAPPAPTRSRPPKAATPRPRRRWSVRRPVRHRRRPTAPRPTRRSSPTRRARPRPEPAAHLAGSNVDPSRVKTQAPSAAPLPGPPTSAVSPSAASATPTPIAPSLPVTASSGTSLGPCCAQTAPVRANTQAAPVPTPLGACGGGLSVGPPISAVVPSDDSATLRPNAPFPVSSSAVSFGPCCVQPVLVRVNTQAAPNGWPEPATKPSRRPADERRRPVRRECDAGAELATAGLVAGGELRALLRPRHSRADEYPSRPRSAGVAVSADQRGVAIDRQRDADPEQPAARLVACGQPQALLAPHGSAAREHPGRARIAVLRWSPYQRGVAVCRECHVVSEPRAGNGRVVATAIPTHAGGVERGQVRSLLKERVTQAGHGRGACRRRDARETQDRREEERRGESCDRSAWSAPWAPLRFPFCQGNAMLWLPDGLRQSRAGSAPAGEREVARRARGRRASQAMSARTSAAETAGPARATSPGHASHSGLDDAPVQLGSSGGSDSQQGGEARRRTRTASSTRNSRGRRRVAADPGPETAKARREPGFQALRAVRGS